MSIHSCRVVTFCAFLVSAALAHDDVGVVQVVQNVRVAGESKITVLSMCSGAANDYCNTSTKNHQDYCDKHGYTYVLAESAKVDKFAKFEFVLRELDKGADFVMWMDADAVFTNMERGIRDLLKEENFKNDLLLARGPQYKANAVQNGRVEHPEWVLNNGVVIFRNSEFAKDFLRAIRAKGEIREGSESINIYSSGLVDQPRFILELIERGELDVNRMDLEFATPHMTVVRPKKLNAFVRDQAGDVDPWSPGDFIAHAAGLWGNGEREEAFARVLKDPQVSLWNRLQAQFHPSSIPQEKLDFWEARQVSQVLAAVVNQDYDAVGRLTKMAKSEKAASHRKGVKAIANAVSDALQTNRGVKA